MFQAMKISVKKRVSKNLRIILIVYTDLRRLIG